ncbi:MAG: hypothetical protein ABEK10_00745 [Candidatus Nanosalina sp.]
MSVDGGPEVETHNGVVEITYDSDGVLALPEGTEYSRNDGEFETTSTDKILALEGGTSVYLEKDSDFEAYGLMDFVKELSSASGDTSIFDPEKTKVYDPGTGMPDSGTEGGPGGSTSVFDPSDYEIDDPTEYTKMMKENADTIILELADRDVTGEEAVQTLDQLFENMNETYDRFVYDEEAEEQRESGLQKKETDSSKPSIEGEKRAVQQAEKKRLTKEEAEEHLSNVEEALKEDNEDERELDDYVDAEELLTAGEQSEIDDFRSVEDQLEEGQSEISDF